MKLSVLQLIDNNTYILNKKILLQKKNDKKYTNIIFFKKS